MSVDVKKVNERWKHWFLGIIVALAWVTHFWSACWFVAHHEVIEAEVRERHDHLFPSRRHGWDCLEVTYVDVDGKPTQRRIQWRATWAPNSPAMSSCPARAAALLLPRRRHGQRGHAKHHEAMRHTRRALALRQGGHLGHEGLVHFGA